MEYNMINTVINKNVSLKKLNLAFQNHILNQEYKTANLLAYWINDFAKYHEEEKNFCDKKFRVYKRGSIIKVNLGFNIGNELGGLHFCIVLEKFDNPKNGTLTVVPLTSKKSYKVYNQSTLNLGKEIYEILKSKTGVQEIEFLKQDSIVLLNQITTISKQRIFNDLKFRNIYISKKTLEILDNKIIKIFTFNKNKF